MNERETTALKLIARVAGKDAGSIQPEQQLVADLGLDSPKALQLMCDLEDELNLEIPEDAVGHITTVADVLALVGR